MVNIILLSGGSGKRLWPLSNEIRSKQFLKIFKNDDGKYESMVQRVYRQIKSVGEDVSITITTGKKQASSIINQLGNTVHICVEPDRRDTFPAVALACSYLLSNQNISEEDPVLVCPVDPYADNDYFKALMELGQLAETSPYSLLLMGAIPTYASEKYGYIIPRNKAGGCYEVDCFKEKPTAKEAEKYIQQGALWNCGVFAFRLGYMLNIIRRYLPSIQYENLFNQYSLLPKISFDYEVVEKEKSIGMVQFQGQWKDIGTWNTLAEEMVDPIIGNAVLSDSCDNVNVINELDIPILVMGAKDMIVSASADGIIVSDKNQSSFIKPYVNQIEHRVMFEEKSWGDFRILDIEKNSLTIKLTLRAGKSFSYHCHYSRDEVWLVLSGYGELILDGERRDVSEGDVINITSGNKHTIIASSDMQIMEFQIGSEIMDQDKEKFMLIS